MSPEDNPSGAAFVRSPFLDLVGAVPGSVATDVEKPTRVASSRGSARSLVPTHYGSPLAEQRALISGTGIVDLSDRGVLSISGEDRLKWLDSLTTRRIARLAPGESAETLVLDPKGHIEHAIRVVDDGSATWLLVEYSQVGALVEWLDSMRFTLRVDVTDRSREYATVGVLGDHDNGAFAVIAPFAAEPNGVPLVWHDPWSSVTNGGWQYAAPARHPSTSWDYHEVIVLREKYPNLAALVREGRVAAAGSLALDALRIAAWRPRQETEVDVRSIPHELDWMRSAVTLDKGCYRGQETVAKVHNLGHPPRRLVFLHADGSSGSLVRSGDDVIEAAPHDGQSTPRTVGRVTSSAIHFELGPVALAIIKRGVPVDEPLVIVTPDGPIAATQETIIPPSAGAVAAIPRDSLGRASERRS